MISAPRYRHLNQVEKTGLCRFIHSYVATARDSDHPLGRIARSQISLLLWRWTADAFCLRENAIKQDGIKYDTAMLPATATAREIRKSTKKGLIHEHCVPRAFIADRIISEALCPEGILSLLTSHCRAVVVSRAEDATLCKQGRQSMPKGWDWQTGCPYARYEAANLFHEIEWNGGLHDCPDDAACRQA